MSTIDYKEILRYLEQYQGVPYSNPDKKGLTPAECSNFRNIRENAQVAVEEMKKIAKRCSELYGLDKCYPIMWLDGTNVKTKKYLWAQMKHSEWENFPISISVFVEKNNGVTRYRISLEIKTDGVDEKIMDLYHSHLDKKKEDGMVYVTDSNEWGNLEIINEDVESIKKKLATGEIQKVQLSIYVEQSKSKTNEQYDDEVMKAVRRLIPYYEYVMEKNSNLEESSEELKGGLENKNIILYGPPGTGKTYHTAIYAVAICDKLDIKKVKDMNYGEVMVRYHKLLSEGRVAFTTFHQSYGYEEFIEGIKPVVDQTTKEIGYTVEAGVFKKFCENTKKVGRSTKPHVFIIDEINRGNISKIFGELITLIEETKRENMKEAISTTLPYSGEQFSVPQNVYILGTMNTADRSIALMDTALRRRFQFIEMMPDVEVLREIKVEDLDVAEMLEKINERISLLYDREHTIGHAFFTKLSSNPTVDTLQSIFEKSVVPLLQEYFYEDYQKIQLVLGDNGKTDPSTKFILDREISIRNIFKGNAENEVELPEKKYTINKEAFGNLESYKQII